MKDASYSNLLMYALMYNSYYTDDELKALEAFTMGFNFGGVGLWNT